MAFNAYNTTASSETKPKVTVNFEALNQYIIDTAECEQPETLTGVISAIVDLGNQKQPDSEYDVDAGDENLTVEELMEKYKDQLASNFPDEEQYGKITKFAKAYDGQKKDWIIKKFVKQKDRQSVAFAVDFPSIQLDKGKFFGDDSGETKPLRLWSGGQFYNPFQKKMIIQNLLPLKVTNISKVDGEKVWSLNPKSVLHKMAVAAKIIKQEEAFLPQDIDKLLGKTLQFKVQIKNTIGKDGKKYYTEKMSFVGALGRGQKEESVDKVHLIQFDEVNDADSLKELRKHVINTIENATNFEGSAIQAQLLEVRPQSFMKKEEVKVKESVVTDEELDNELPF